LKANLIQSLRAGAVGALLSTILGWVFLVSPLGHWFANFSYDAPFALRPDIAVNEAVVVLMDEQSHTQLQQPPEGRWDRALHIPLIRELAARRASAVVFDILFDEPWPTKGVDEALAAAIRDHGRVVIAMRCERSGGQGMPIKSEVKRPVEPIASAAAWGFYELPSGTDSTVRQHYSDPVFTNLAWQAAALLGQAPPDFDRERWINYYGPPRTIPHVSYSQVLETNALPADFFTDRVVFVGMAPVIGYHGSGSEDEFVTPYTRWTGLRSPGAEIHATAFVNLVRRDWLTRLSPLVECSVLTLLGLAFGFGLVRLRPVAAFVCALASFVGLPLLATLLVWTQHLWFGWAIAVGIQLPAALVWTVVWQSRQPPVVRQFPGEVPQETPSIPDHTVLRCIGQGSYGEVWLARNVMGTYRAIKVIHRKNFESETPFEREFAGIRHFEPISRTHEGFVDILQVGQSEPAGFFYYVMELADDPLLGQQINPETYTSKTLARESAKRGPLPPKECVQIGLRLSEALAHLHEQGLVHRDIKPSNIVYISGIPKLADIGLVAAITEARSHVGTEGFIPPEGPGTPQADLYSLGKALYEISMGRDRRLFPELPTDLEESPKQELLLQLNEIILKACAKQTRKRYLSARKTHEDLNRLLGNEPIAKDRRTASPRPPRKREESE
jgi:CHASE2 domain-containing sensor protein